MCGPAPAVWASVRRTLALALPKDIGTMCAPAQCQWVSRAEGPHVVRGAQQEVSQVSSPFGEATEYHDCEIRRSYSS